MISRIPTPNTFVDTALFPIVKVTLGPAPEEGEYRIALGRLRTLRARGIPHFIIVDANHLRVPPSRHLETRVATFVLESAALQPGGALGVAVITNTDVTLGTIAAIRLACNCEGPTPVVQSMSAALVCARRALGH